MSRHTYVVFPRVLCFVFNGDSVLLLKSSKEKDWYGYFEPPGGHIEKGEDIIESAEKEIYEETGLRVANTKLVGVVHVTGFYGKEIMLFLTKSISKSNNVVGSHEGEPVWIPITSLNKIKLLEDIKPILEKILTMKEGYLFVGTSRFDGKDKLISFNIRV